MIFNKNKKEVKKEFEEKFEVAIIGAGQTGLVLAKQLIKKEIKTLVIDRDEMGIKTSLDLKNLPKLIKRIKEKNEDPKQLVNTFPQRLRYLNHEQNKDLISQLTSNSFFKFVRGNIGEIEEYSITVNDKKYAFKKLVFATGSYFTEPTNFPNLRRNMYLNLNEIGSIKEFYPSVAVYGTNVQALEVAYSFALMGSKVYLFDENVNPFNNFDDDFESILKTQFMPDNIVWCLESKITNHIQASDNTIRIMYRTQGQNKFVEVHKIIITDNKKSETRTLKTKYPLELNSKGSIIIDNTFKVKENPTYYAIGDVNGIKFMPEYANSQAITLSRILTNQKSQKFNLYDVGFVIDIEPQFAFYGMNRQDLEYLGMKFNEFVYDFDYELNSKLYSHKSKMKVYTNEKHEILGIFLYGNKIKELLGFFILAANNKVKFHKLSNYNYPFYSKIEFVRDAAIEYELEFVGLSKKLQKMRNKNEKGGV